MRQIQGGYGLNQNKKKRNFSEICLSICLYYYCLPAWEKSCIKWTKTYKKKYTYKPLNHVSPCCAPNSRRIWFKPGKKTPIYCTLPFFLLLIIIVLPHGRAVDKIKYKTPYKTKLQISLNNVSPCCVPNSRRIWCKPKQKQKKIIIIWFYLDSYQYPKQLSFRNNRCSNGVFMK